MSVWLSSVTHFTYENEEIYKILRKTVINCNDIVDIIGRVNAGKSYLLNCFILLSLKKTNTEVLYIDSRENYYNLLGFLKEKEVPQKYLKNLRRFTYDNLCELSCTLHSIGNWIIGNRSKGFRKNYVVFIDTLDRIERTEEQNGTCAIR